MQCTHFENGRRHRRDPIDLSPLPLPLSRSRLHCRLRPRLYIGLSGVVASQASWMLLKARMGLRGPLFRPFGGFLTLVKMVVDPVGFWDSMTAYAKEKGMSLETLFGVPVVFVTDNQLSKEV